MSVSITTVELKIERVVRRGKDGAEAEFLIYYDSVPWMCCQAWTWPKVPMYRIQARATSMTIKQAQAVSVALRMATEWILEEKDRQ
ncbi:MAG TPA: hypothetical protein VEL77_15305 [Rugosimonospora sp.]|nr:hypothetical protein [Rugosimonospora sp.]